MSGEFLTTTPIPGLTLTAEFGTGPGDHCRVYWGSHGCDFKHGHEGDCACDCCECGPEGCEPSCVAKPPYYGEGTRFYGEDVEARGLPSYGPGELAVTRWKVRWHDTRTGKDGRDTVEAPTAFHAVWEVASGYKEEYITDMEFVSVEPAEPPEGTKT